MDEPLPANSIVKENKIEGSPPEDVEDLPRVVVGNITDSFVLRESVPDPLPAIVPAPLPPAAEPPAEPAPSTVVVVVVPEEPVDTEPTTDEPVPTTDPPVVTTTEEPPVTTTEPPVTTTEPPVVTTEPEPTTTTEPPTTTTEEPDPVCLIGLELDPILGVCVPI